MDWKSIVFAILFVCLIAKATHVVVKPKKKCHAISQAQYVRLYRNKPMLELAEVQVYDDAGLNVAALYGKPSQSSVYGGNHTENGPMNAINGNTNGHKDKGELARTASNDLHPFWEVQLPATTSVKRISVFLRDHDHFPNPESEFLPKHNQMIHVELLCPNRKTLWTSTITYWQPMYDFHIN